ncbi:MAG TPA: thiamine ABC transporter substrate-binding protein [Ilumatobacteraceae bacterium]|nr:thiamine ABC transporter substrate-binding protein [Ilumatobacteraceae bacterium]
MTRTVSRRAPAAGLAMVVALVAACGGDDDSDATIPSGETVTLVTYDSFPEADTSLNAALASFTEATGIEVEILVAGDTGTMLAKASLTAGNPEGDVMWGIDNSLLSRAIADEVFEPYVATGIADGTITIAEEFLELVPDGEATPVDYGDVCVNYDIGWFTERDLDPPATLADLVDPVYGGMLVVQNPATSSPGLAFLLATVHEYGLEGWQDYWRALGQNGVEVVDGWTEAYYERFTWAGGGPTPMVVSYGSSPPAEVIFADPPRDDAPTGVIEDTCFRQVEFAGVLRGTDAPEAARRLVDFLIGEEFQAEVPLNLFVYPTNDAVELPAEFVDNAVIPEASRSLDPAVIDANRSTLIDEWTELVLG